MFRVREVGHLCAYPASAQRTENIASKSKSRAPLFAASPILRRYLAYAAIYAALACSVVVIALDRLTPSVIGRHAKKVHAGNVPPDIDDRIFGLPVVVCRTYRGLYTPYLISHLARISRAFRDGVRVLCTLRLVRGTFHCG